MIWLLDPLSQMLAPFDEVPLVNVEPLPVTVKVLRAEEEVDPI